MEVRDSFAKAFKLARRSKSLTQEDFSIISSRTFVSLIERGGTSPSLDKLDSLCTVLNIHPVTLLAFTYLLGSEEPGDVEGLLDKVCDELKGLLTDAEPPLIF